MKKEGTGEIEVSTLRVEAEKRLRADKRKRVVSTGAEETRRLLHELEVHKVELAMQNKMLLNAQLDAEKLQVKYADLYDFAPVGYLTLDKTGLISEANLTAVNLLGVDAKRHLLRRPFLLFVSPGGRDGFYAYLARTLASDAKETIELALDRKDGTSFHAQLESIAPPANGERAIRMTIHDITPLKKKEEELREAKKELESKVEERAARLVESNKALQAEMEKCRRLTSAVEQSVEGVLLLNEEDLAIEYANRAFLELSGYAPAELVGGDVRMFRSEQKDESFYDSIRETIAGGESWTGDYPLKRKDGSVVLTETAVSPIRDASGKVISRVVTSRDITEKRVVEAQLRQAQKMEAIGTLAGGIAHDFNNILGGIIGFTEMAMDEVPLGSPALRRLKLVLKSGIRGRDLVRQILAFSRKAEYEKVPLSLSPLVKETVKLLRAAIPATIEIRTQIKAAQDAVIASPAQIQQVIMNLCGNAAQAMNGRVGKIVITLDGKEIEPGVATSPGLSPGKYVELAVEDSGAGMDAETLKRVFEPFFTTREAGKGTGLGLSVVYGIVKMLGGSLSAESAPGTGSVFRVVLPLAEEDVPEAPRPGKILRGKERILFVDDEELLAELGKSLLERLGYTVTSVTEAAEALRLFEKDPFSFDLVFTDMTMPKLTGLDVAVEILKKRPDMPIILCTGYSDQVSTEKAVEAGIRGFFLKPLSRNELAIAVRKVLDKRKDQ